MTDQKSKIKNQKSKIKIEKSVAKDAKKVTKKVVKPVAKVVKTSASKNVNLSVSVYGLDGKSTGRMNLSAVVFGQKVNKKLLAQAVRVYQANKRQGNASTKTRSEVDGSSRKIYRQKGTGRARHGTLRAPIFVKGGIVHGPKPRDFNLDFPKKMRRVALYSALSAKLLGDELRVISGLEKIEPKTKKMTGVIEKLSLTPGSDKILLIIPDSFEGVKRGSANLRGIIRTSVARLNALDVLKSKYLIFAKESISDMEKVFLNSK